jgi:diacylglycerol kinase family enzyme
MLALRVERLVVADSGMGGGVPAHQRATPTAGERVAALAALVTELAAVGLVLAGIVAHLIPIIAAAAGLLICVVACWYVVSRRGVVRVVSAIVAVAFLAAAITSLVFADLSLWRLALVIVLSVLSVGLARHALRRDAQAVRAGVAQQVSAAQPDYPVLIMNPKSGGGKAERFHLADECRRRGIEPVLLEPGDDLLQLAEDAVGRGADVIGMAGGDGSQALVASVAARHDIPYVCVPAGTRNHFALDLGLDRSDVTGALDAFADGIERRIDLATVNGRTFVNNASLGLYAKVVQSPEYRDAKLRTAATMLPDLIGPDSAPLDLRFTGPDDTETTRAQLILVSNDPYQLVQLGGRGTRERIDTGVLGVVAVAIADAAAASRFAALEATGQLRRFPGWLEWSAPRFEVSADRPVEVGVDGEALMMDSPVVFESRPGALRVRLPRRKVGASPAARAVNLLSASTVAELWQVTAASR